MRYKRTEINTPYYTIDSTDDFLGVVYTQYSPVTITLPEISVVGEIAYTIVDEGMNL